MIFWFKKFDFLKKLVIIYLLFNKKLIYGEIR